MKKEEYPALELEIIKFDTEDVVLTSDCIVDEDDETAFVPNPKP